MKNRKVLFGAIFLVAVVALIFGVLKLRPKPGNLAHVRIGFQPIASNLPLFVAVEKGFFRNHGLEVEPVRFETADAAADALLRGDIDTDFALPMLVFLTREQAASGTFVAYGFQLDTPEHSHEALIVVNESNVKQLSDLNGKSIGVFPGVAAKTYLTEALVGAGLKREEIQARPLQVQLHLQSLQAKQIDALLAYEPAVTQATTQGFARILESGVFPRHLQNPFPVTVFAMTRRYAAGHPQQADAIVAALGDAIDYISSSPQDANTTVIKYTNLQDAAMARKLGQPLNVLARNVDAVALQRFIDWHHSVGLTQGSTEARTLLYSQAPTTSK